MVSSSIVAIPVSSWLILVLSLFQTASYSGYSWNVVSSKTGSESIDEMPMKIKLGDPLFTTGFVPLN